ncbi:phage portal protein [Bacillus velezensis]|uniref:phage portal protein n=1 Tax=Bacillus TaxID=1386 RepID=UPI001C53400F|nr:MULTISPECIES: phage portal protein [Bacillus amyloliquefaciens group]QXP99249.1 phage portal protein [Bacillus velezensis]UHH01324.1 phage portal protein [Bacillus amyloliquefaciens]ULR21072.1 phage portal protein [Bacillus velezensis]UVW07815.1 phage portal protein [Bacillus velezensis]WHL75121.1 phage portal protein [Bacillus velezensis]
MGLWNRAVGGLRNIVKNGMRKVFSSVKGPGYDFSRWFFPYSSGFGTRAEHSLTSSEPVYAAVSRLANSLSSMPLKMYKAYKPTESSSSALLTDQPNNNMTTEEFINLLEVHRNVYGNGYAIKKYDRYFQVEGLEILDPLRVFPVYEEGTKELWYEVHGDYNVYHVHNTSMIHVHTTTKDGKKGISRLDVLRGTLNFDTEVRTFALEQMDGAKLSFILKLEANVNEEKIDKMRESFQTFYRDNGGVIIQEAGTELKELEKQFIDKSVFDVDKVTRSRVASVFHLPLFMVGESDGNGVTQKTEELYSNFVKGTLLPIVRHYETEFNRKLLTTDERTSGYYFKFNMNALLRADTAVRGTFYQQGIRNAFLTPNEVRAWEELPPLPGGDVLLASKDLFPLEQVANQKITEGMEPGTPKENQAPEKEKLDDDIGNASGRGRNYGL